MGVDSEMLGNKGSLHSFEFEGKTYTIAYLDRKVKSAFEKNLFRKAREMEEVVKDDKSPEEYQTILMGLNDKFLAGEYSLVSKNGMAYLKTQQGIFSLTCILMGVDEDLGLRILSEKGKGQEIAALVELVMKESFPYKGKEKDPQLAPVA